MTWQEILFSPNGRIRRRTFWLWSIVASLASLALNAGNFALWHHGFPPLGSARVADPLGFVLVDIALLVPNTYVTFCLVTKRWHDRNRPTWPAAVWAGLNAAFAIQTTYFPAYSEATAGVILKSTIMIFGLAALIDCGLLEGTRGRNAYGPSPKGLGEEAQLF